jgi:hypothetical protein
MKLLRNQKGQMTIEAVMLLVIALAFAKVSTAAIKEQDFLRNMVSGPWTYLQGMIQNGVWSDGNNSSNLHPNVYGRRASPEPI